MSAAILAAAQRFPPGHFRKGSLCVSLSEKASGEGFEDVAGRPFRD